MQEGARRSRAAQRPGPLLALAAAALALAGCGDGGDDGEGGLRFDGGLRLNQIQVKGTHNSYHLRPEGTTNKYFDYSMPSLTDQLARYGVRQFELDVHYHPAEGRFAVYHTPEVYGDPGTTCFWLGDCLSELRAWSDAHLDHHTLLIYVELKDDLVGTGLPLEEDFIAGHYDDLDAEILSVWPRERLVVPDDVQRDYATLAEAITLGGWPTVDSSRGRALLIMMDGGTHRNPYAHDDQDLHGRVIFAHGDPGRSYVAVQKIDDPLSDGARIGAAVRAGYLVRTRADATDEPLAGDTTRQQAALASGAQMVSTDYPAEVPDRDYWFDLADGTPSRCNPVNAPSGCTARAIEDR